jgi:hypothetical protein
LNISSNPETMRRKILSSAYIAIITALLGLIGLSACRTQTKYGAPPPDRDIQQPATKYGVPVPSE